MDLLGRDALQELSDAPPRVGPDDSDFYTPNSVPETLNPKPEPPTPQFQTPNSYAGWNVVTLNDIREVAGALDSPLSSELGPKKTVHVQAIFWPWLEPVSGEGPFCF